jgi:hypothetical protein
VTASMIRSSVSLSTFAESSDHGRPGNEQLGRSFDHHAVVARHDASGAKTGDRAEATRHDRHGREVGDDMPQPGLNGTNERRSV